MLNDSACTQISKDQLPSNANVIPNFGIRSKPEQLLMLLGNKGMQTSILWMMSAPSTPVQDPQQESKKNIETSK